MNANKNKVVMNKNEAEDPPCTNCCKYRMSDKENSDTWTIKKRQVSVQICGTSFIYLNIFKEGNGHPHQVL